jgi:cycloeucalenol cycloisomerase
MFKGYWFSKNPDRAWAEKLYLIFIPIFFIYNAVMQAMGWLDADNFWHITQNLLMWLPYCVLLPLVLRRKSGIVWYQDYWFKFQLWIFVFVFFATYFHTEWFFSVLGMRYRFPHVTLYFDSRLCGPDEATAMQRFEKIPVGMYLNTMAFFTIYHNAACVVMRRVKSMTGSFPPAVGWASWVVIVAATALFFAWAETFFYIQPDAAANVWYIDKARMLAIGSFCYALYFIVSFPDVYRLDEPPGPKWNLMRCAVEAGFVSMVTLFLIDLFAWVYGPIV